MEAPDPRRASKPSGESARLAALERAEKPGAAPGPYTLQAAIAACHARARTSAETRLMPVRRAMLVRH